MKAINYILFIICILVISCRQEVAVTAILEAEDGNFTYSAEGSTRLLIMDIPIGSGKSSLIFDTGGLYRAVGAGKLTPPGLALGFL